MADSMAFPKTMEEFIDGYSFNDSDKVYTNGVDLIPTYRVIQGFGHYEQEIRNKAIDELVEKLATNVESFEGVVNGIRASLMTEDYFHEYVWKIAEQMKGV